MAKRTLPQSRPSRFGGSALIEQKPFVISDKPPLKVDAEKGIIEGVRILGRYSPNTHGQRGVESSEYTPTAMKQAVNLYEGVKVYIDHKRDRKNPGRSTRELVGVIRNPFYDGEDECVRGNLHYYTTSEIGKQIAEDVEKRIGAFGLSHSARAGKTSVANKRYVIEEIAEVYSVDLVDDAATNRNLWESNEMETKTFSELLESWKEKKSKARQTLATKLLEDDTMPLDAPIEAPPTNPDDALTAGFKAAILAVVDDDSMSAADKMAKIKTLLTTQEKLTSSSEPKEEEDDDDKEKDKEKGKDGNAMESLQKQLDAMKAKEECRDLCESVGFVPTKVQLKSMLSLNEKERKEFVEDCKKVAESKSPASGKPKSGSPPASGKKVEESKGSSGTLGFKDAKEYAASIRG